MTPNTSQPTSTKRGGSGSSRFARNGAISLYVSSCPTFTLPSFSLELPLTSFTLFSTNTPPSQTAPPDPAHPRILSELITLAHESKICKQAFPPGKHFTVPSMPNVTAVNVLGDFDIRAERLAIIDGEGEWWIVQLLARDVGWRCQRRWDEDVWC